MLGPTSQGTQPGYGQWLQTLGLNMGITAQSTTQPNTAVHPSIGHVPTAESATGFGVLRTHVELEPQGIALAGMPPHTIHLDNRVLVVAALPSATVGAPPLVSFTTNPGLINQSHTIHDRPQHIVALCFAKCCKHYP